MAGSFHFYDDQQLRRSLGDHREIVTSIRLKDAESALRSHGIAPPVGLPVHVDEGTTH